MTQIQVGSAERRLAQWVLYAALAAPIVATLLHDLGVGAVAPWIIYAILAAPMIVMLSHREVNVDRRGCGHWSSGTMKIAHPLTATQQRARQQ